MKLKRSIKHFWQRQTRGFDDSETWNLDHEFAKWLVPRLKRYKIRAGEVIVIDEEFAKAIEDIITGFEIKGREFCGDEPWTELNKKVDLAMEQFNKHWQKLWW